MRRQPRHVLRSISLVGLESSVATVACLWRAIRDSPGLTLVEAASLLNRDANALSAPAMRLRQHGWLDVKVDRDGKTHRFIARTDGRESRGAPIGERLEGLRRRLSQLSANARGARYSGLATRMGSALAEIEKEAKEIRDDLYVRR